MFSDPKNPGIFYQNDFSGGMNFQQDPALLESNEYALLINGRTRDGTVKYINLPRFSDTDQLPQGIYQGCYAAGNFEVVFISGLAYYKDLATDSPYQSVNGFLMSTTAETLWAELIPAATLVQQRKLIDADDIYLGVSLGVASLGGASGGLIVQDGINQPWIIFADGSARVLNNYDEWQLTDREYVPIGRQMKFKNGVLFCVSQNGRYINRSVTGRPGDFMIVIDSDGNKLATEELGGAQTVSISVGFEVITCLGETNDEIGSLFVTSLENSYLVYPNLDKPTVYGEFQYNTPRMLSTGAINHFAYCDGLGDNYFIDSKSVRSFNSVLNTKNEGRYLPFTAKVIRLFEGDITQNIGACIEFDGYLMFSMQTIFGAAIIIHDTNRGVWEALDIYPGVINIKQFAKTKVAGVHRLFFITSDNKHYEYNHTDSSVAIGQFLFGEASSRDKYMLKPENFDLLVSSARSSGTIAVQCFSDRKPFSEILTLDIDENFNEEVTPYPIPYGHYDDIASRAVGFDFGRALTGWRISFLVKWDFKCELGFGRITTKVDTSNVSNRQESDTAQGIITGLDQYKDNKNKAVTIGYISDIGGMTDTLAVELLLEKAPDYIIIGGNLGDPSSTALKVAVSLRLFQTYIEQERLFIVTGEKDLDSDLAQNVYNYINYLPYKRRYYTLNLNCCFIVVTNSAYGEAVGPAGEIGYDEGIIGEPDGITTGSEQGIYIREKVAESRTKQIPWRIGFSSIPAIHSGNAPVTQYPDLDWVYNEVELYVSGQQHVYERLEDANSKLHIVAGNGGAALTGFGTVLAESKRRYNATSGFLIITANTTSLNVRAYAYDDSVIDERTINRAGLLS